MTTHKKNHKNFARKLCLIACLTACLSAPIFWRCADVPSACSGDYPHPYNLATHFCHPNLDGREIPKNEDGRDCNDHIDGVEPCTLPPPPCVPNVNCEDDIGRCIIVVVDDNDGDDVDVDDAEVSECTEGVLRSECDGAFEVGMCPTPEDPIGACTVRANNCNPNVLESECRGEFIVGETCPSLEGIENLFVDLRDWQVYRTVAMPDGKVWMAENLNFPMATSWCYDDYVRNCDIYGRLYTWDVAQNACPAGWRLPSGSDWNGLTSQIASQNANADKLKSQSGWHDDTNGTDEFGFTALPGGFRNADGVFRNMYTHAVWWTSSQQTDALGIYRQITHDRDAISALNISKSHGFSVRCVRN